MTKQKSTNLLYSGREITIERNHLFIYMPVFVSITDGYRVSLVSIEGFVYQVVE